MPTAWPTPSSSADGAPHGDGRKDLSAPRSERMLVCRVGGRVCALPLAHVAETMRPLAVEPLGGMPAYVSGLAVIRGVPTPVVDARTLLGDRDGGGTGEARALTRFVVVRAGERAVALAVEEVIGIRDIPAARAGALPPLLGAGGGRAVAAVGALDAELLVVLQAARLLSEADWAAWQRAREQA